MEEYNQTSGGLIARLIDMLRAGEPDGSFWIVDQDTIGAEVRGADIRFSLDQLRIWLHAASDAEASIRHTVSSWLACLQPSDESLPLDRLAPMIKPVDWGLNDGDLTDPLLSVALDAGFRL